MPNACTQPPDYQVFPGRGTALVYLGVLSHPVLAPRLFADTKNADVVILREIARYLLVCKLLRAPKS